MYQWPASYTHYFNPRAPRGARPGFFQTRNLFQTDFNPRAPRGARPLRLTIPKMQNISIHALREERDSYCFSSIPFNLAFQSTRSARSATLLHDICKTYFYDFNPRAPRGARQYPCGVTSDSTPISIHALREERDKRPLVPHCGFQNFNPRAPRGARQQKNTKQKSVLCDKHKIL